MDVKERILAKAEELFMRYGIKTITMDDIARDLAISKKTIYQYFKDKDDLVYQMGIRHFENDKCEIRQINQVSENAIEQAIALSRHLKNNLKGMNPSVFLDLQRYHPKAWKLWQEYKREFIIEQVKHNIRQGVEEGLYKPDLNIDILAILRVNQIEMAFDVALFPPDKFDILTIQITFLEHFIRGIVTQKGYTVLEEYFAKEPQDVFKTSSS